MTRLRNLPDATKVYDVFKRRPDVFVAFTEACERIMRADSPLSRAERELIGADAYYLAEAGPRIRDLGYGASLEQWMCAGE